MVDASQPDECASLLQQIRSFDAQGYINGTPDASASFASINATLNDLIAACRADETANTLISLDAASVLRSACITWARVLTTALRGWTALSKDKRMRSILFLRPLTRLVGCAGNLIVVDNETQVCDALWQNVDDDGAPVPDEAPTTQDASKSSIAAVFHACGALTEVLLQHFKLHGQGRGAKAAAAPAAAPGAALSHSEIDLFISTITGLFRYMFNATQRRRDGYKLFWPLIEAGSGATASTGTDSSAHGSSAAIAWFAELPQLWLHHLSAFNGSAEKREKLLAAYDAWCGLLFVTRRCASDEVAAITGQVMLRSEAYIRIVWQLDNLSQSAAPPFISMWLGDQLRRRPNLMKAFIAAFGVQDTVPSPTDDAKAPVAASALMTLERRQKDASLDLALDALLDLVTTDEALSAIDSYGRPKRKRAVITADQIVILMKHVWEAAALLITTIQSSSGHRKAVLFDIVAESVITFYAEACEHLLPQLFDAGFCKMLLLVLRAMGPPTQTKADRKLVEAYRTTGVDDAGLPYGMRTSAMRLVATLCSPDPPGNVAIPDEFKSQPLPADPNAESGLRITDRFRTELGGLGFIPLLMNHTVVDAAHPGAREWAIFGLRNVLFNHPANQAEVEKLQLSQVSEATNDDLKRLGMVAERDSASGKIRIRNVDKPQPVALPKPEVDDDFM